jgi:hypothetical protein
MCADPNISSIDDFILIIPIILKSKTLIKIDIPFFIASVIQEAKLYKHFTQHLVCH